VDCETQVPADLYARFLLAGQEASMQGVHRLVEKEEGIILGRRKKNYPRLVRNEHDTASNASSPACTSESTTSSDSQGLRIAVVPRRNSAPTGSQRRFRLSSESSGSGILLQIAL